MRGRARRRGKHDGEETNDAKPSGFFVARPVFGEEPEEELLSAVESVAGSEDEESDSAGPRGSNSSSSPALSGSVSS